MPRKEAQLVPFLQKALEGVKYRNLILIDPIKKVFCLYLPHKTNRLCIEDELIFKDWWHARNGKKYVFSSKHYTEARQAMTSSLRKSDYVEPMCLSDNKLICRILSKEEVEEKKKLKKELKKLEIKHEDNESGYESSLSSPESHIDGQNDKDLLQSIEHDHAYLFYPPDMGSVEGSEFSSDVQNISNEDTDTVTEAFDRFLPLGPDSSSELESIIEDHHLNKDICAIFPVLGDFDDSLQSLFNIPNEQLIGSFKELQLSLQVPGSNDVKTNIRKKSYFCEEYELVGKAVVLICKLLEMDVDVAGTSSNIGIVFGATTWKTVQEYTCMKGIKYVGDNYLIVILELP
ncbi:uncharacterized protein LOC129985338 [Argiope bruennichi]|uniref:Uncharacterized protein n=1 Tax=Argiope bruennichi TaxID=94029 RepID=A0A8T0EMA3_ARGBR|nr:uncharacterized protein LOC129985338 [Argiope bruennichi]XP_055951301.1 uncharacterized protein LOC129985338 [Argiope bruennichi]KAF8773816.1 hypothetical protein HNY73_016439 [Argiope bruennichi]